MELYKIHTCKVIQDPKAYKGDMVTNHGDLCYVLLDVVSNTWLFIINGTNDIVSKYRGIKNVIVYSVDDRILYYNSTGDYTMFLYIDIPNKRCSLESILTSTNNRNFFYITSNELDELPRKNKKLTYIWNDKLTPRYSKELVKLNFPAVRNLVMVEDTVPLLDMEQFYQAAIELGATEEEAECFKFYKTTFDKEQFFKQLETLEKVVLKKIKSTQD